MRLRERKHITYNLSGTDDSGNESAMPLTRSLQESDNESVHSGSFELQVEGELNEVEDDLDLDEEQKVEERYLHHRKRGRLNLAQKIYNHENRGKKSRVVEQASILQPSSLYPRSTRGVRVNYNEDTSSESSTAKELEKPNDNDSSDTSSSEQELSKLEGRANSGFNEVSFELPIDEDPASDELSSEEKARSKPCRRLMKLADRRRLSEIPPCEMPNGSNPEEVLKDAEGIQKPHKKFDHFELSCSSVGLQNAEKSASEKSAEAHTVTRTNKSGWHLLQDSSEMPHEKIEDELRCQSTTVSKSTVPKNSYSGIEFLAYTYARRPKSPKVQQSGVIEGPVRVNAPALMFPIRNKQLKVDLFGPYWDENEIRPVVKRAGQVEKVLSVRNRQSDSPIYCVKLSGKSYRSCVYVNDKFLARNYPHLVRNFLKRMDDLHRANGNPGEQEDGPAFNPLYIQIDRIIAAEQRVRKNCYLVKWCGLPYSDSTWEFEDALADEIEAIKRFSQLERFGAPTSTTYTFKDGRVLRDYQKKGVAWMDHNYQKGVNCILADEMGLGKTIQSIAMLQNLRVKWKIKGPFLVVAPVSTLGHWQREIESLTNMNCLVYSGSADDRNIMKEYEFWSSGKKPILKFNVLLTGYEVLMKDHFYLAKHEWQYIIVDEAHRLKTKQSKTSRTLKEMSVKKGGLLLLTGTPVQNNTKEIFGLLNILDPDQFKSEDEFLLKYGDIKNVEQVKDLQDNILKPRLLRRMKEDVEKSIPLKEETIIWVELTHEQRSYYKGIYENRIADLLRGSQSSNLPNLRNVAMELRKLCNHPFLCDGLEEHLTSKFTNGYQVDQKEARVEVSQKILCQSSGKMLLLDKLLPMLKDSGHRVLIFSQFTMMLDLLEEYLHMKGYSYERIDGKIRGSERQAAIDRYSARGSETFVFLLSTRAGGLGITLTAADTCIIYDSDWNPQNDLQAMARCHRIGQTKDVKVYRLITRNTYEQHLFECSSRKYGLDEAILGNILGSGADIEHSKNIESLLKRGAYDLLKEEEEADAAAFHAQNIDQILEQRTQKRLIGGRGNNSFSVATFISTPETTAEEIDDGNNNPNFSMESGQFWQELLPDACQAVLTADRREEVPYTGPRRRAQVNYKEKGEMSDEGSDDDKSNSEVRKRATVNRRSKDADVEDGVKQWSDKEVKRLENRLLMLGKGREEQILVEAELEHRGLSEVQQLADTLIQFCHYFVEKEESEEKERSTNTRKESGSQAMEQNVVISPLQAMPETNISATEDAISEGSRKDSHANPGNKGEDEQNSQESPHSSEKANIIGIHPQIPPFARKALTSQYFLMRLQKNAAKYLQILHERDVLSKALATEKFSPVSLPRSKKLPIWWGDTEDLNLMQGALKHGHKEFTKIREDPSLCFAARLDNVKHGLTDQNIGQKMEFKDEVQEDEWPHDSVLAMRLKKIIECLPNGLSDREIKRRAAVSEAAKKRWMIRQSQEALGMACGNSQMGFIVYIDGVKYEQPVLKHVPNKLENQSCDSRLNSTDPLVGSLNQDQNGGEHDLQFRPSHSVLPTQEGSRQIQSTALVDTSAGVVVLEDDGIHCKSSSHLSQVNKDEMLHGVPSTVNHHYLSEASPSNKVLTDPVNDDMLIGGSLHCSLSKRRSELLLPDVSKRQKE